MNAAARITANAGRYLQKMETDSWFRTNRSLITVLPCPPPTRDLIGAVTNCLREAVDKFLNSLPSVKRRKKNPESES